MSEKASVIIETFQWSLAGLLLIITAVVDAESKKVYSVTYTEEQNNG